MCACCCSTLWPIDATISLYCTCYMVYYLLHTFLSDLAVVGGGLGHGAHVGVTHHVCLIHRQGSRGELRPKLSSLCVCVVSVNVIIFMLN